MAARRRLGRKAGDSVESTAPGEPGVLQVCRTGEWEEELHPEQEGVKRTWSPLVSLHLSVTTPDHENLQKVRTAAFPLPSQPQAVSLSTNLNPKP